MSLIRSSLLLGAGAAAGGYQIERSLRFNSSDSASLSRASYAGSGTFSCWVKRCKLGTAQTIISGVAFNASDQLNSSTAVFRDPSAWMHVLVSTSGTYVNGTSVASGSAITPGIIGSGCDLYLADIHFIDGQALTPSSFTEVSATTGQLIPKAYTGTYGTNGFHLPFSDNSATTATTLGKDTSGNGNNWTPNNFQATVQTGRLYAQASGTSTSAFSSATLLGNFPTTVGGSYAIYDADLLTATTSATFSYLYIFSSLVEVLVSADGTNWTSKGNQSSSYTTVSHTSAFRYVRWFYSTFNFGITNNPANNDSLVDTPTSYGTNTGAGGEVRGNYSTLSPITTSGQGLATLTNGNLDISGTGSNYTGCVSTIAMPNGKWYWEYTVTAYGSFSGTGIVSTASLSGAVGGSYGYAQVSDGWFRGGTTVTNNAANAVTGLSSISTNDVINVAVDVDAGKIWFGRNGTWESSGNPASGTNATVSFTPGGKSFYALAQGYGTWSGVFNAGARSFAYTAPSGFKALCDTNLTSTTITTSGSYTGNGTADGPFVYLNGVPTAMTIGGNAVTFGTHADKLSNGFKIRTSSTTYNQNASSYSYSITSTDAAFKNARAQPNP